MQLNKLNQLEINKNPLKFKALLNKIKLKLIKQAY